MKLPPPAKSRALYSTVFREGKRKKEKGKKRPRSRSIYRLRGCFRLFPVFAKGDNAATGAVFGLFHFFSSFLTLREGGDATTGGVFGLFPFSFFLLP